MVRKKYEKDEEGGRDENSAKTKPDVMCGPTLKINITHFN